MQKKHLITFHSTGWLIRILPVNIDFVDMVMPKWLVIQLGWDIRGRRSCEVVGCAIFPRFVESQSPESWLTGLAQCPPPRWNQKASWVQCPKWHTSKRFNANFLCNYGKTMKTLSKSLNYQVTLMMCQWCVNDQFANPPGTIAKRRNEEPSFYMPSFIRIMAHTRQYS